MGERIRALDWSRTPLGAIDTWSQSLKTAASLVLSSKFAMVIAWGPEFVFLYNDAYRPVLGSKHPASLGRPGAEIFPEVWDTIVGPLFRKAITEEAVAVDDYLIPLSRSTGFLEECYFTLSYSPIRGESGGVEGLLAVVAETTVRVQGERGMRTLRDLAACAVHAKTAEQAMQDATRVLAENSVDIPFALGYLVEADASRLVARSGVELSSELVPVRIPLDANAPWPVRTSGIEVVANLGAGATNTAVVLPITRPGLAHPYGFVVAGTNPLRELDDRYRTFFELAVDHIATGITNARAYEEERRRAEALAALDRAKTAFFSNISHEFRTPLTLMLGPTEEALAAPQRSLTGDQLDAVYRSELRLLKLVNALLDFARIEAGRIEASYRPTDLARLTADLASTFRSTIERAGLVYEVDTSAVTEPAWVDDAMWEKIVLNLISNAFKFTFEGKIRVALESDARVVRLSVSDTGTGIPADELPRVFERFHRVHGARARTHEGSGIGLALVHELVELHRGTISVRSELDRGSVFAVEIPRGSEHLPQDKLVAQRTQVSTAVTPLAFVEEARRWTADDVATQQADGQGRVLVVDDNSDMRQYLRGLLEPRFAVELATDGIAALAAIHAHRPDVVITDVMMPNLDGFGLLREMRRDPSGPRIPVIMVSARAGEESRVEGISAGADDYVVKPFSSRELIARVQTQLELVRLRAQSERERADLAAAGRAKDEFLAMLGHELRNPLAPIQTALDLIATRPDAPFAREREIIARQIDHMVRLVDDLLDVSRITRGKIDLVKRDLDLGQVIVRTLEVAGPMFERRDHQVHAEIAPNLHVEADETRLAQIITNLVTNASKYTPRGGRIEITAAREGAEAVLRVRDNGIGIAQEMLPHVFDMFAQEHQSLARSEGGLGLGLAIVHSLVALHGGTVTASSEGRGLGATFTVRLPAKLPSGTVEHALGGAARIEPASRRVLVVDDNVDAAELLAESLRQMGHETAVAFDGPDALRLAEDFKPEVALLDIGLPTMSGYELARRLVENNEHPVLLVAISGYGLDADRKRSEEAGFAAHLVKPIRVNALRGLLERG